MKVQDVMTYDVQTCGPETNLSAAAMQMWKGDFGALPVVAGGKVVAMITDRDICIGAATKDYITHKTTSPVAAAKAVSHGDETENVPSREPTE